MTGAGDVLNIAGFNPYFLIVSRGVREPFTIIPDDSPGTPYFLAVASGGGLPGYQQFESGPGVLARLTVEGHNAGLSRIARDVTSGVELLFFDDINEEIPVGIFNNAFLAVSKDLDGDGTVEPVGSLGRELFTCSDDSDADGSLDVQDECPLLPGPALNGGCPPPVGGGDIDSDGDGVVDNVDACPQLPGVPERMGCPVPAVGGIAGLLDAASAERESARVPSEDERGGHALTFALVGISAALLAGSALAFRLRRRSR